MKSQKWLFIAVAVAMLSGAQSLFAQQCYITYVPNFSSYTNVAADETNIYTAVGVDGSGVMSTSGSCPNLSSIYHYSILMNSIGSVSSGWVSGSQNCPDCYVSDEQDEDLPYDPDTDYTFNWEADMSCSFAGTFFSSSDFIDIELAYTKSKWNGTFSTAIDGGAVCYVSQWCTVASQPALCDPSTVTQEPFIVGQQASCWQYYNTSWLAEKFSWQTNWGCFPLLPGQNAIGTSDSSVATCTKHP